MTIRNETSESRGLKLENYVVGSEPVHKLDNNWQSDRLGRLNFDAALWDHWNAW